MSLTLLCPVCERSCEGLTLYVAAGAWRWLVCAGCYAGLVAHERQRHSRLMQRLRQLTRRLDQP